ncbi:RNA recognition motif 2-domain-containing protein [Amylocarpus encephaloides]|uniref:RNA recognition motif 2-domain-containing protein n=1 Tax=Amylocarpus encephaloides TaxID=45428 RepID=A0A9P7YD15_9HELO|nr:RNA recognition motif 2-domain-containing protein [Amylocarpus encephaloides]
MLSTSPHSSSGSNSSFDATPESKLTVFSPEDQAKSLGSKIRSNATTNDHQDPFVTSKAKEVKLSATASAFQPFGIRPASNAYVSSTVCNSSSPLSSSNFESNKNNMMSSAEMDQFGTFTTDTGASRCMKVVSIYGAQAEELVKASLEKLRKTGWEHKGSERVAAVDSTTVYIRESNIADAAKVYTALKIDNLEHLEVSYVPPTAFGQAVSPQRTLPSSHEGQVYLEVTYPADRAVNKGEVVLGLVELLSVEGPLCAWQKLPSAQPGAFRILAEFYDSAIAVRAVNRLHQMHGGGTIELIANQHNPDGTTLPKLNASPLKTPTRQSTDQTTILTDQLGNMAFTQTPGSAGRSSPYTLNMSPSSVDRSRSYGPNMGMNRTPGSINRLNGFHSHGALHRTTPGSINRSGLLGTALQAMNQQMFTPPVYQYSNIDQASMGPVAFPQQNQPLAMTFAPATPASSRGMGQYPHSVGSGRRQNAIKVPPQQNRRHGNPAAGQHNHVDTGRIQEGMDVRTTVMLRNIPNKVDQAMLKSIIDESSFGRYDFMYLRIDFSNNCNVGYAFINFVDPLDIVQFVHARSNQKWHRFKSDKVAEVSYATIQGRDCLIQKFRNSSVMLEPPHYRPKLFLTVHDPFGRAGQEDQFPGSDNASKLKRSCENAEHVGLFAPSAGQHLRDEQRRRHSQYDRGTSLAEQEEYNYEAYEYDNSRGFYNQYPSCRQNRKILPNIE